MKSSLHQVVLPVVVTTATNFTPVCGLAMHGNNLKYFEVGIMFKAKNTNLKCSSFTVTIRLHATVMIDKGEEVGGLRDNRHDG